jgi:hypothetical protein
MSTIVKKKKKKGTKQIFPQNSWKTVFLFRTFNAIFPYKEARVLSPFIMEIQIFPALFLTWSELWRTQLHAIQFVCYSHFERNKNTQTVPLDNSEYRFSTSKLPFPFALPPPPPLDDNPQAAAA